MNTKTTDTFQQLSKIVDDMHADEMITEKQQKDLKGHIIVSACLCTVLDGIFRRFDDALMPDTERAFNASHYWFDMVEGIE